MFARWPFALVLCGCVCGGICTWGCVEAGFLPPFYVVGPTLFVTPHLLGAWALARSTGRVARTFAVLIAVATAITDVLGAWMVVAVATDGKPPGMKPLGLMMLGCPLVFGHYVGAGATCLAAFWNRRRSPEESGAEPDLAAEHE